MERSQQCDVQHVGYVDVPVSPSVSRARELLSKMHDQREYFTQVRTTLSDHCNNAHFGHDVANKNKVGTAERIQNYQLPLTLTDHCSNEHIEDDVFNNSKSRISERIKYYEAINHERRSRIGQLATRQPKAEPLPECCLLTSLSSIPTTIELVGCSIGSPLMTDCYPERDTHDEETEKNSQSNIPFQISQNQPLCNHTFQKKYIPPRNNETLFNDNSFTPATENLQSFLAQCDKENWRHAERSRRSTSCLNIPYAPSTKGIIPGNSTRENSKQCSCKDKFSRRKSQKRKKSFNPSKSFDDRDIVCRGRFDSTPAYVTFSKSNTSENHILYQSVSADDADFLGLQRIQSNGAKEVKLSNNSHDTTSSTASVTTSEGSCGSIQRNGPRSPSTEQITLIRDQLFSAKVLPKDQCVTLSQINNKFSIHDIESPLPIMAVSAPSLQRSCSERELRTPEERKIFIDKLYKSKSYSSLPEPNACSNEEFSKLVGNGLTSGLVDTSDVAKESPTALSTKEDEEEVPLEKWLPASNDRIKLANIFRTKLDNYNIQQCETETLSISSESSCDYTTDTDTSGWVSNASNTITLDDDSDLVKRKPLNSTDTNPKHELLEQKQKKVRSKHARPGLAVGGNVPVVSPEKRGDEKNISSSYLEEPNMDFGFVVNIQPKAPKKRVYFAPDHELEQLNYLYAVSEEFSHCDEERNVEPLAVKPLFVSEDIADQSCFAAGGLYGLALTRNPVVVDNSNESRPISVKRGKAKQLGLVRWSTDFRCGTYGSLYDIACRSGCEVIKNKSSRVRANKKARKRKKKFMATCGGSYDIALRSGLTKKGLTSRRDTYVVETNLKSFPFHVANGEEIEVLSEIISDRQCGTNLIFF